MGSYPSLDPVVQNYTWFSQTQVQESLKVTRVLYYLSQMVSQYPGNYSTLLVSMSTIQFEDSHLKAGRIGVFAHTLYLNKSSYFSAQGMGCTEGLGKQQKRQTLPGGEPCQLNGA